MKVIDDFHTFKEIYSVGGKKWIRTIAALERGNELKKNTYYSSGDSLVYILTNGIDTRDHFIGNRRYFDVHFYLEGSEEVEYANKESLESVVSYSDETDRERFKGAGIKRILKKGQIVVFNTEQAYKLNPLANLKKIVVKVTVEHNFFTNK